MSRNIGIAECDRCGVTPVLSERPRKITRKDACKFYEEFEGLIVAHAVCPQCGARYLAWVNEKKRKRKSFSPRAPIKGVGFFDLSYRSTFNEEPGPKDLPPWTPPITITAQRETVEAFLAAAATVHPKKVEIETFIAHVRQAIFDADTADQ